MPAGFVMDADPVCSGVSKCRDVLVWIFDQQVAVKRQICGFAKRLDHRRPERDVGNEVTIHHIHMDDAAAAALCRCDLVGKAGKISRKYGGNQLNHDKASVSSLVQMERLQPWVGIQSFAEIGPDFLVTS